MQTIFVKSITNLAEARYCAGMMVDMISFEFNENHPDYVNIDKFNEIRNWISGVKIIGQNANLNALEINALITENKLDGFLFEKSQIDFAKIVSCEIKILEKDILETNLDALAFDMVILTGEVKNNLSLINNPEKTLLGYDFENISIKIDDLKGYAFKGSPETRPGQGNYDNLIETLEILES